MYNVNRKPIHRNIDFFFVHRRISFAYFLIRSLRRCPNDEVVDLGFFRSYIKLQGDCCYFNSALEVH